MAIGLEKVYPEQKASFGTLLLQKRVPSEDKADWNAQTRQRTLTHLAYELESSVQEGAIVVLVPVKEAEIDTVENFDKEVELVNPVCELSSADVRNGKANYEIYASKIKIGGNK